MTIKMPSLRTVGIVLLASILGASYGPAWHAWQDYKKDQEYRRDESHFSRWLTSANEEGDAFGDFLSPLKSKGLYVCAVEGRWNQDHAEFRVRLAKRPKDAELHRYWWFGLDEATYKARLHELTEQNTFKCVSSQHFTDGLGVERYQVVFLKFLPLNSKETPVSPAAASTAPAPDAGWSPQADEILANFGKFYAGLQSFQATIKSTTHVEEPSMKNESNATGSIAMARPNYFALRRESGPITGSLISDGKTVTAYQGALKRYTSTPAPPRLAPIVNPMDLAMTMMGATFTPPVLVASDPAAALKKGARISAYLGQEEIGGRAAHHFRFSMPPSIVTDVWIAAGETPLLLQATRTVNSPAGNKEEATVTLTDLFSDWQIDQPIPPETFAFHPPPDATLVTDFTAGFIKPEPPSSLLGQPAPDFTLDDLDGHPVALASLKGKVIVLDFWATWCPPCCKALPLVSRTALSFADKGVAFYAVDVREKADAIHPFLTDNGLSIPVLLDASGHVSRLYKATSIPQTFVIDRNGVVQAVHIGYHADIEATLQGELDTVLAGKSLNP